MKKAERKSRIFTLLACWLLAYFAQLQPYFQVTNIPLKNPVRTMIDQSERRVKRGSP